MQRRAHDMYFISTAAELLEMHPQTLRKYERLGLVRPQRVLGSMRVYTDAELARIRLIKALVDDAGINLAGVRRLLSIADVARRLQPLLERRHKREQRAAGSKRSHRDLELERTVGELLRLLGVLEDTADVEETGGARKRGGDAH
jgi:MerR family transcriptional regulator, heat shock protein HspR